MRAYCLHHCIDAGIISSFSGIICDRIEKYGKTIEKEKQKQIRWNDGAPTKQTLFRRIILAWPLSIWI